MERQGSRHRSVERREERKRKRRRSSRKPREKDKPHSQRGQKGRNLVRSPSRPRREHNYHRSAHSHTRNDDRRDYALDDVPRTSHSYSPETYRRRRHRSRSRRRNRNTDSHRHRSRSRSATRHGSSRSYSPRHRRRNRRRGRSYSDRSRNSSPLSEGDHPRRNRRYRYRRGGGRRGAYGGQRNNLNSPERPQIPRHAPPVAGIVSDDDEQLQSYNENSNKHKIPGDDHKSKKRKSDSRNVKKGSTSSGHDDTVGHYTGQKGTVIADRYRILQEVGVGTFGRVVECLDLRRSKRDRREEVVAIKIVRDVKRYYESALIEADIVEDVNRMGGRGVSHCARMFDTFSFSGHYCMVFEKLGPSLYDWLKSQKYRPFPISCVRDFAKQLLETVEFLHSFRLIHTDLKPENILLLDHRHVNSQGTIIPASTRIKIIDFGGATYDNEKKSSVVNTRQYRAPEVILGTGWGVPSDLWSVGCILAELYQGELLFATHDNLEHLALIERIVGPFPRRMLKRAKNTQIVEQAFDSKGNHRMDRILPPDSLDYVRHIRPLESIVFNEHGWFLRLLRHLLVIDPDERASARECVRNFHG